MLTDLIYIGLVIAAALASFTISTLVIRIGIPRLKTDHIETKSATTPTDQLAELIQNRRLPESSRAGRVFDWQSTGYWIGMTETVLIFILVFASAFNALAIIIGAKQFVRNEKIKLIPSYYLLGTLANLCLAVLFAIFAKDVLPDLAVLIADRLELTA